MIDAKKIHKRDACVITKLIYKKLYSSQAALVIAHLSLVDQVSVYKTKHQLECIKN